MLRPTASGSPEQRILLGILLVCLAGAMFPVMNAFSKQLGGHYSPLQISWARFFGHVAFLLLLFLPRRGWRLFCTRRPKLQLARSAIQFVSNLAFTTAIFYQPIADAAAIGMMGPLIVTLLAWPMLGERTTPGRAIAVLVGFVGVLIVIRPGGAVFHWSALLLLVSAVCYALYQVVTRMVANIDPPETTTIYSSLFGAFGMLLVLPFIWKMPHTFWHLFLFCGLGVIGAIGHYMIVHALAYAPANVVSPFQYFQLIGSVGVGYVWFGDFPDAFTWLGSLVIVCAGLYVGWSQTRKAA
ncbi:MAG: DMT family transporter [Acetobacteraceae bacterium]|nr:DMT family transporter [Acetobacteraceae bacterium]